MSAETTGRCKLTELVTNHVFSNINRDKLVSVMNCNGMSHEIRGNH